MWKRFTIKGLKFGKHTAAAKAKKQNSGRMEPKNTARSLQKILLKKAHLWKEKQGKKVW